MAPRGIKISRPYLLISGAWLLNGAAWFLPTVTGVGGGEIGPPINGWQAFVLASGAARGSFGLWYAVLAILSILTTLFFLAASTWVVLRGSRSLRRACSWVATAAFLFNAHWYVHVRLSPNGWISDLGIGYFLWWLSFVLLAIGLFDLSRRGDASELTLFRDHVFSGPRTG
jgi:hypothetical protein